MAPSQEGAVPIKLQVAVSSSVHDRGRAWGRTGHTVCLSEPPASRRCNARTLQPLDGWSRACVRTCAVRPCSPGSIWA